MKLVRPMKNRMIAGVCAGIAAHYGWDTGTLRVIALLTFLFPGPNVLAYIALWVLIPSEGSSERG